MSYGEQIVLLDKGLQIPPKTVQPLGILDQSLCWGTLLADPRGSPRFQLVVSPIHPDSWPFLFHLRLYLRQEAGVFARTTRLLANLGVNILISELVPGGFHHAIYNIVGEAAEIKRSLLARKKSEVANLQTMGRESSSLESFGSDLANAMFNFAARLKLEIYERHDAEGGAEYDREIARSTKSNTLSYVGSVPSYLARDVGLLHHRIARGWNLLYDETRLDASARNEARRQRVSGAETRWLEALAFFSVYGLNLDHPMLFRYNDASQLLELKKGDSYRSFVAELETPTIAVGAFDPFGKFILLDPVARHQSKYAVDRIRVGYRITSPEFAGESSSGLLADLSEKLSSSNINILRVSNKIIRRDEEGEEGRIILIGKSSGNEAEASSRRAEMRSLLVQPPSKAGSSFSVTGVEIGPYPIRHLFLSLPSDPGVRLTSAESRLLPLVQRVATSEGWITVRTRTYTEELGSAITQKIGDCDAFLQIVFLRTIDDADRTDFPYLHYEYGLAVGLGLPALRMVDLSRRGIDYWKSKLRVDPGRDLMTVNLQQEDRVLEEALTQALRQLEQKVLQDW